MKNAQIIERAYMLHAAQALNVLRHVGTQTLSVSQLMSAQSAGQRPHQALSDIALAQLLCEEQNRESRIAKAIVFADEITLQAYDAFDKLAASGENHTQHRHAVGRKYKQLQDRADEVRGISRISVSRLERALSALTTG